MVLKIENDPLKLYSTSSHIKVTGVASISNFSSSEYFLLFFFFIKASLNFFHYWNKYNWSRDLTRHVDPSANLLTFSLSLFSETAKNQVFLFFWEEEGGKRGAFAEEETEDKGAFGRRKRYFQRISALSTPLSHRSFLWVQAREAARWKKNYSPQFLPGDLELKEYIRGISAGWSVLSDCWRNLNTISKPISRRLGRGLKVALTPRPRSVSRSSLSRCQKEKKSRRWFRSWASFRSSSLSFLMKTLQQVREEFCRARPLCLMFNLKILY